MKDRAVQLDFQLYLEGVPIPFESAVCSSSIGSPATAEISIPPTIKSQKVLPRTAVHLFYYEQDEIYDKETPDGFGGELVRKLLFEGEVMGISYSKTPSGRSTRLYCVDHTNNFDYAHRYMIEDVPMLMGSQCNKYTTGTKPEIIQSNTNGVNLTSPIANLISNSDSLVEGVSTLIKDAFIGNAKGISTNEFLESVEARFKLSERVVSIEDLEIDTLVELKSLKKLLEKRVGKAPPTVQLSNLIDMFLNFVFYNRNSILTPSYNSGKIQNFILSPNIYFSPPPKCNVLFPDHISNFGIDDMFMSSPTRMFLQAPATGIPGGQTGAFRCADTYVAPREIGNLLEGTGSSTTSVNNSHRVLTSEEKIKGIVPVFKNIGEPEFITSLRASSREPNKRVGTKAGTVRDYMLNMAEYELDARKAMSKSINQMSGPFNPEVVTGAPVAVLDEVLYVFGILQSVRHSISAVSGSETTYAVGLPRRVSASFDFLFSEDPVVSSAIESINKAIELDKKSSAESREKDDMSSLQLYVDILVAYDGDERAIDIARRMISSAVDERDSMINQWRELFKHGVYEDLPESPRWINKNYDIENASNTYKKLYGCGSIMDPYTASNPNNDGSINHADLDTTSMAVMASDLMGTYKVSESQQEMARSYGKRSSIVSQLDFNSYYGLPNFASRDAPYPAIGPFTPKRQARMLEYVNELRESVAHRG